jgi:hypothetical protein
MLDLIITCGLVAGGIWVAYYAYLALLNQSTYLKPASVDSGGGYNDY